MDSLPSLKTFLLALLITASPLFAQDVGHSTTPRDSEDEEVSPAELKFKPHAEIKSLAQTVDEGVDGNLELRFQPIWTRGAGCETYPVVDNEGYIGQGLKPSGKSDGKCAPDNFNKYPGQMYVRRGIVKERMGIMYAMYIPKFKGEGIKSRHGFLVVVVWTHSSTCDGEDASNVWPVGVSLTKAGNQFYRLEQDALTYTDATHPQISTWNERVLPANTFTKGRKLPLVSWHKLPRAAQKALNSYTFGPDVVVPFITKNFHTFMEAAYDERVYEGVKDPDCHQSSAAYSEGIHVTPAKDYDDLSQVYPHDPTYSEPADNSNDQSDESDDQSEESDDQSDESS